MLQIEIARYFKGQMVRPARVSWFENSCFDFIKPFIADFGIDNYTKIYALQKSVEQV